MLQGGHGRQLGDLRPDPEQTGAAEGRDAIPQEADREQEPQHPAVGPTGDYIAIDLLNSGMLTGFLGMQLTDACVKNGGSHFLQEIASREFIDNLISLMNAPAQPINLDVKHRMLELIQAWSYAFEGQPQLTYVNDTYRMLKQDGHQFPPPPQQLSKNFIDSSAVSRS